MNWNGSKYKQIESSIKEMLSSARVRVDQLKLDEEMKRSYLTFEAATEGWTEIYFGSPVEGQSIEIEYSTDGGEHWNAVSSEYGGAYITEISQGETIQVRGTGPLGFSNNGQVAGYYFYASDGMYVYGNAMSLLSHNFTKLDSVPEMAFSFLFNNGNWVLSHPNKKLLLPAKNLSEKCYYGMFYGCTSLITPPTILAKTTAVDCCSHMFESCTSLAVAPILSATEMSEGCYNEMFYGCSALVTSPELPAMTLANSCYKGMFFECTSLKNPPILPATELANSCYDGMFDSCSSLKIPPRLPATVLQPYCYSSMFHGCSSLTEAPALPATTIAEGCYIEMFGHCDALKIAPALPATSLEDKCYMAMFKHCTNLITAPELPATTLAFSCYESMFDKCSSLIIAPALPAKTLVTNCYCCMFYDCSSLKQIDARFITAPAYEYTEDWVYGVAEGGTFLKDLEAEWDVVGNDGVPSTWRIITEDYAIPLTFEAKNDDTKIYFRAYKFAQYSGDSLFKEVEVSTDGGITWTKKISTYDGTVLATLSAGQSMMVRGENDTYGYNYSNSNYTEGYYNKFDFSNEVYVYGNIMSLIRKEKDTFLWMDKFPQGSSSNFWNLFSSGQYVLNLHPNKELLLPAMTLTKRCYSSMFSTCCLFTTTPRLPATVLADYCYYNMFQQCKYLTTASELPAGTMAESCYSDMFRGCDRLVSAPALPALNLAKNCYSNMFIGCSLLASAPALPATQLAENCYSNMFYGCSSLTTAPSLSSVSLAKFCYSNMFKGCTNLTTAPSLPATIMKQSCYSSMFKDCTNLEVAPELPATTLETSCYSGMFSGCTKLSYIKAMFTTTPGQSYTSLWVKNVNSTGTFVKNSEAAWDVEGDNGIPSGWTVETASE